MKTRSLLRPITAGLFTALLSIASAETTPSSSPSPGAPKAVHFNRDIRPILVSHCTACHGGVKQAGEVSFVYPEQVLPPDGWVIEPGDPDASALIERVEETDPDLRMPPPDHGPALSKKEVGLLREWISQGARWQQHWAFEPPAAPSLPDVTRHAWPRRDLDRFVLAKLEAEGLTPSDDAAPARWLRRTSLDLTGLPPTPDALDTFLADIDQRGEAAYAEAVDRLLASPHFGERWASVWLDQVRYADSKGLGSDAPRSIWKYRDWVIDAFNADLPYDEFTVKQIAGDLLPERGVGDLIATACHRLTQSNDEGGTDDEEFRLAAVLDRVNTTWQTWQGVTFGCVQCHSHPYDPFRHDEYYRFAAFFNNTADSDLGSDAPNFAAPIDPADNERAIDLDREIDRLKGSIWSHEHGLTADEGLWRPVRDLEARTNKSTKMAVERLEGREEFRTVGTVERNSSIIVGVSPPEGLSTITALRVTGGPLDPAKALSDSEWGFVWSHVRVEIVRPGEEKPIAVELARIVGDEPHPLTDPAESLNEKSQMGFGVFTRIYRPRSAVILPSEPIELGEGDRLRVVLRHDHYLLSSFSLITSRGSLEVTGDGRLTELLHDPELTEQHQRLSALKKQRKAIKSVGTPVLAERPDHLKRRSHVFERGLFLTKGELVEPGTPESFPPLESEDEAPTRLDLARWFVADDNPLTARVAVNRFWSQLFGVGLVQTEEDFGSSGEPPSHPGLLDHLAVRFQDDFDWSVKRLLKEIVLSSTYRQTSAAATESFENDPANRLLSRGPRSRLSAETIRDQALAVSGLLDRKLHGWPVRPPLPGGVWLSFAKGDKWPDTEPGDPSRYRRSVYTYTKRSIPYPMMATFDAPSREFCVPRRLRSNTPLQALELLNSEAMAECAAALAERMREHSDAFDEQVGYGYRLAVSRSPSPRELEILRSLREKLGEEKGLRAAATALLNLDETVTK
ncbi:Planctomycete cytochrome C [Planctomycetes bacterium MalM25]|nr:Planctomycete cytochrome C [Planctomycetes bacterium MalM25]